jgi:translation initiation factor 2B subunit (eIF-2B alpha/beta/delta family)
MQRQAAALARDRVSGATALARRAARLLRSAARDDGKSLTRWQQQLRAAGEAIAAAQPAMGALLTVVDLALRAARQATTPRGGAAAVRRTLNGFLRRQPAAIERAARRLALLLPPRATCLTLSSSEVVYRALLGARRRGRLMHVIVAESRPAREGLTLARRLARRGIGVTVMVDALAPAAAREVDAVVVGADAVTPAAVWNKCGTFAVAVGARLARRPLFVITSEDRLLGPALARRLRVPEAEPHAVLARPGPGVRVLNRLFDVTPLHLVTAVVTEAGVMRPASLRARLARGASSPAP